MPRIDKNNVDKYLNEIDNLILSYEAKNSNSYDHKYRKKLEELLKGWDSFIQNSTSPNSIPLTELKTYVEGYSNALFIDKIEVSVTDLDIPFGVILVDLPGLAVSNKRHIEFTKTYIKKEAKAFVVCGKPDHLFEGEEIELLEEINKNNSKILQRSFWVINKWDTVVSKQKEEIEKICEKKQEYFSIKSQRLFKLSALRYFLAQFLIEKENLEETVNLKAYANDILPPHLKNVNGKFDIDKVKNYLATTSEVKAFSEFKIALFQNLTKTAIDEFIAHANLELFELVRKLLEDIPAIDEDFNQDRIVRKKIRQALDNFWQDIDLVIQEAYNSLTTIETNKLWDTFHTKYLTDSIEKIFSFTEADIESFKKELEPEYQHSDFNFARLPKIVDDKIYDQFSDDLEKTFDDAVKNIVSKMNELLRKIKAINPGYFPQEVIEHLEYLLGREQMLMRLRGNRDVLFLDLGAEIQSASFKVFDEYQKLEENQRITKTDEVKIKDALIIYKTEMINFIDNLAEQIDKVLRRTVKNHAKMIQENLNKFLKDQKESIDDVIDKQVSKKIDKNLEFEIQYETQKHQVIKEASDQLKLFL
jgi:hypothetical protein